MQDKNSGAIVLFGSFMTRRGGMTSVSHDQRARRGCSPPHPPAAVADSFCHLMNHWHHAEIATRIPKDGITSWSMAPLRNSTRRPGSGSTSCTEE